MRIARFGQWLTGLRGRLTAGMLAVALATSLVFVGIVHEVVDVLQDQILERSLNRELNVISARYARDGHIDPAWAQGATIVTAERPAPDRDLQKRLGAMQAGGHDTLHHDGHSFYAGRRDVNGRAIYLLLDIDAIEAFKQWIVWTGIAGVFGAILLTLLLAGLLNGRILSPVRSLADHLAAHRPGHANPPIAAAYRDPDIRAIAERFDRLVARFDDVLAREKAFTEDASHELRTPLATALNASELLADTPDLDARTRQRLQRIQQACDRMHRLVAALLFLAREPSDIRYDGTTDAADVLDEVLAPHRGTLAARHITLDTQCRRTPIALPPGVLLSLLHNPIENAIRHTEDGTLHVEVTPRRLQIADSGSGMTSGVRAHVHERRYRTATSPGLGMGLYLVSRICDRQNWILTIESTPGIGTTLTIDWSNTSAAASAIRPA